MGKIVGYVPPKKEAKQPKTGANGNKPAEATDKAGK